MLQMTTLWAKGALARESSFHMGDRGIRSNMGTGHDEQASEQEQS